MFELIHNENNKKAPMSLMREYLECDKIILNASKNTKVIFHHLKENYDMPNRKAGFYNVNTGEDIELKQGQIHESEAIGYDDMNNGWIRYGILPSYEKENKGGKLIKICYVSSTNRDFANKGIKFVEKKYPNEIFDRYDIELISGPVSGSLLIQFDSNKKKIIENKDNWLRSSKNIFFLKKFGILTSDDKWVLFD